MVGVAIRVIGLDGAETPALALDKDELAAIASRLTRIEHKRVPYSEVVEEEGRISTALQIRMFHNTIKPVPVILGSGSGHSPTPLSYAGYLFQSKTAVLRDNQAFYTAAAAECRKPYSRVPGVRPPSNWIGQSSGDTILKCRKLFVRNESMIAVLSTEIALLRYHADHGAYPARLADIAPHYLKSVPIDPFGQGKPIIYRLTNGGKSFLLYSRGMDMRDDGGRPTKWIDTKAKGDYVAGKLD